jgi:hypothetical protein
MRYNITFHGVHFTILERKDSNNNTYCMLTSPLFKQSIRVYGSRYNALEYIKGVTA